MNKLFKNKFLRENLVLLIILGLIFPQYAFSDAWVADTGNDQVSRLYKDGHAPTVIKVTDVGEDGDTVAVNINPTGLFYPGLKLSFGMNRADVYEIDSVDSDIVNGWVIKFTSPSPNLVDEEVTADSPIYMELVRSGGFESPVSVSTNTYNTKVWFADDSTNDSGITQFTGWGRDEPSDTPLVKPWVLGTFWGGESEFNLLSQDKSIYPGIKIDFYSDNRAGNVLETKDFDIATNYLATTDDLLSSHSIIDKEAAVIHIDRFRDKSLISPKSVSANSITNRKNSEYDTAWAVDTGDSSVVKYTQEWEYRRTISIDPTKIDAPGLTNFPLMVKLDSTRIDYGNTKDNGEDIRFTDVEGTPLRYEIEKWDETDPSVVWVKVPEISNTDTTIVYMYYGNSDATDAQDTQNVWDSNFKMVQHLDETSGTHYDSTANANNGTPIGGVIQNATGKIDGTDDFDIGYIEVPGSSSLNFGSGTDFTMTAWIKAAVTQPNYPAIIGRRNPDPYNGYIFFLFNNGKLAVQLNDGAGTNYQSTSSDLRDDTWHHVVATGDRNGFLIFYVDGVFQGQFGISSKGSIDSTRNVFIGWEEGNPGAAYFDGMIDEVRISDIARSAEWIKASYDSENDNLITFGGEQDIRYAGLLKVGGFNNPKSISVNSSNGEVWIVDADNSEVVKLYKGGHKTISATVLGDYATEEYQIALTDISEIDSGIKISFNGYMDDAYRVRMDIPEDWWDLRWAFRKPLILDKNDILGDEILIDFPVMVKLTPVWFDYSKSSPEGADIRFVDIDGSELPYEIEEWVEDDTSIIWVNVPNIPANDSGDSILIYYGYPQASDNQKPKDVWNDNYVMVQHLQEDPSDTAPQILDSTINSNDGTVFGSVAQAPQGQINGTLEFAEIDDYVKVSDSSSLDIADTITVSAWLNDVSSCPWLDGWLYREKITIDHTLVDSDLVDFPVAVILDTSNFDFSRARSDGFDIRFTDFDGHDGQDTLLYERERHDSALGLAEYWVKIPDVSSDADTVLYMYWGKSDAADGATDAENVWDSNFKMVQHLDETSGTHYDSTANANNGTPIGGVIQNATGKIDGTDDFDIGYIEVPGSSSLNFGSGTDFTMTAWIKAAVTQPNYPAIIGRRNPDPYNGYIFFLFNNGKLAVQLNDGAGTNYQSTSSDLRDDTWHHVVATGDRNGFLIFYVDGVFQGQFGISSKGSIDSTRNVFIGWEEGNPGAAYFDGMIDEVRISDIARSAEWIKASYYSQNNDLLSYEETEFFGTQINKDGAYGIGRIKNTGDTVIGIINNNIVSASIGSGWQQVVLVYDGVTQKLYVGGDLVADTDLSEPINININDFIIGGSSFNGPIDEIRISDTALSDSWIKASFASESDKFIDYDEPEESIGLTLEPALNNNILDGSSVARELARISGFTEPVAVAVDFASGDCWVADGSDTVVWINGDIGEADISTAGYNINTNAGYHRIITGFADPVSVAIDPLSGDCWVACNDNADSYIVRLDKDVSDGYALNGNRHIKIYGFDLPNAVSIDPSTGDCYVADGTDGGQIVRLAPEGHKYTGYMVDGSYSEGDAIINLSLDTIADSQDTLLYRPLKVSFGNFTTDIEPVYEIESVEYDNVNDNAVITILSGLEQNISSGIKLNKELARVGGFDSPTALSAFKGSDLGLGLHPWRLQVREFYDVAGVKYPSEGDDGWRDFPANIPIHDATPQFRWRYIDIDGDYRPLDSYQIRIWTLLDDGGDFVLDLVWDSDELPVDSGREIYPGQWIYSDWDNVSGTNKENDSTGIYSTDYGSSDEDDCPDLSQIDDPDTDLGDRTYFVQLMVKNRINLSSDTYPQGEPPSSDTSIIVFTLDKTPPGSYRVCGTEVFVPVPYDNTDNDKDNIKKDYTTPTTIIDADYYQTDNYYWDEVWVQWDGGDTEIVGNTSMWIPKKQVTVRTKVKDRNNENLPEGTEPEHKGHNTTPVTEFPEDATNCSGISLNAQYRFRSTLMAADEWSEWFDCEEVRLYDEDALMSNNQGQRLLQGGVKDDFVWLYAKNVLFADGDTNLIQFRVLDEGYMEVSKIAENALGDTAEVWIAPNMGYSHADTIIEKISSIEHQTSSVEFGYKLKIDSNVPQVILVNYPSNPYPHSFASFKWVAIDTTPCRFKYKLEWLDNSDNWVADNDGDASDGEDCGSGTTGYSSSNDDEDWTIDATSVSYENLQVGRLYRFWVKAKDLDGVACDIANVSRRVSTPAVWVWYVSPEVPNTIITYGPSGQTTNNSPTFRWRGVGGMPPYTYNWKLRGSSLHDEGVSYTYKDDFPPLNPGTYVFEVRASDNNGSDPTPARRIFTVVDPDHPPYSTVSPKNIYKYFREIGE